MLVAVISDTHLPRGKRQLPDACLERLRTVDHIVHAGDLSTVAILDELKRIGPPVSAVYGNADEQALRDRLPARLELELDGTRLGVVHNGGPAARRLDRLRTRFPGCAAVVFGHSHVPLLEQETGFAIFNPGSPTDRRRQPEHSMGLARIRAGRIAFEHIGLGR